MIQMYLDREENDEGKTLSELIPSVKAKVESKVEGEVSATTTTTSPTKDWLLLSNNIINEMKTLKCRMRLIACLYKVISINIIHWSPSIQIQIYR